MDEEKRESIVGCGMSGLPKPENGRITRRGKTLYYHIMEPSIGSIPLYGISRDEVKAIRLCRTEARSSPLRRGWCQTIRTSCSST